MPIPREVNAIVIKREAIAKNRRERLFARRGGLRTAGVEVETQRTRPPLRCRPCSVPLGSLFVHVLNVSKTKNNILSSHVLFPLLLRVRADVWFMRRNALLLGLRRVVSLERLRLPIVTRSKC